MCLVLLHGNGTSSSDDSSAEVSSIVYMVFTSRGSPHTSLMVIILALWVESSLSLPLRDIQAYDGMQVPYMMRHPVDKDVLWADHISNTSPCIRGRTTSIWGLHPDTITYVVYYQLLFGLIWRECIDTFQLDAVAMNQHATRCFFEQLTPVDSSETAVCGFCLSISLHIDYICINQI